MPTAHHRDDAGHGDDPRDLVGDKSTDGIRRGRERDDHRRAVRRRYDADTAAMASATYARLRVFNAATQMRPESIA